MATITTDVYLDDAPRTAGESWTIDGGVLTVRTDTRVHANAPAWMTGSIGVTTISSTLWGWVLLDARNVRWMPFDWWSGTVPAIGTLITQGGVEGYLLGVWADYVSAPVIVGDAMPTTWFLKFREVTGWTYSVWALTWITANATAPDRLWWIEVVQRQSVANTVPRLWFFKTRGGRFELDNTNGTAGQVVQIPTNGGGNDTTVPAVWIETGVGTDEYESYPAVYSTWFNTTNLSTDDRSKFVLMDANGAVRIGGNGTDAIGFLPPSWCKIRIPNVIGRQSISASDNINQFPHPTFTSRPDFLTTSAGVIDFEYFMNDWYHVFSSPYSVRIVNCATMDVYNSQNEASPCYLKNYVCGISIALTSSTLIMFNNSNGGTIKNIKFYRGEPISARHLWTFIWCNNFTFDGINEAGCIGYSRVVNAYAQFVLCDNIQSLDTIKVTNGRFLLSGATNSNFNKVTYIDRFVWNTNDISPLDAITMVGSCNNININSVDFGGYDCNPNASVILVANSKNCTVRNIGDINNPIGGSVNAPSYIYEDDGNNINIKVHDAYLSATRSGLFYTLNTSSGLVLQNIYGTAGGLFIRSNDTIVRGIRATTNTVTGQNSVYGTHWSDMFTSDTDGIVKLSFNEPTEFTATQYEAITLGTGAGFTSTGALSMPNLWDQVIWTMETFVQWHTGFQNVAPLASWTGVNNFSYEFDIDLGFGFSWSYSTLDATNLSAISIDPVIGFRLKIRITCITSLITNALTYISIYTTSTLTAQENIYYPTEFFNIKLNWILANTRIQIYDVTNSEEIYNSVITSAWDRTKQLEFNWNFTCRFRLMLMTGDNAYQFIEFNENITMDWLTRTIDYVLDQVYNNNGIDWMAVTNISIDDDALLINVTTWEISRQEIYAYETYWLYTEEGIRDEGRFIVAVDEANYVFENFKIKNTSDPSLPLVITWWRGRDEATGEAITLIDITWWTIFSNPDIVITSNNNINTLNKIKKNTDLIPALL